MGHKILVIDDDKETRQLLKAQLERKNHRVVTAASGQEGLRKAFHSRPELVILDVTMPGMDGWDVCRRLRDLSDVPIIMLTARTLQTDVIQGLDIGADDYIKKPYSAAELEARIRAVIRRAKGGARDEAPTFSSYTNGQLTIDFDRHIVTVRGERINLTPTEFKLLSCLVQNAGRVLPHRYLLTQIWGPEYRYDSEYVKLYIRYLRRKIEKDPSQPVFIQTEWGEGYRFSDV